MKLTGRLLQILSILIVSHLSFAQNLSYNVSTVWKEGADDSLGVYVNQSGNKAIASMTENGRAMQVSDPSAGIMAARPENKMALLVGFLNAPTSYKPGDIVVGGFAEDATATVTSFDYSLEKTKEKQTLEGEKAEKYVMKAILEVSVVNELGQKSTSVTTGEADYWVASKLPFSWLPYTLANNNFRTSAVPFGFVRPGVASFLLDNFKKELMDMGLLLKATAKTTVTSTDEYGEVSNAYIREVTISNLESGAANAVEMPDLEYIEESKFAELMGWMFISRAYCSAKVGEITTSASDQSIEGKGTLQFQEVDEKTGTTWLSAGNLDYQNMNAESGCLIIGMKPSEVKDGEYTVMDQENFAAISDDSRTGAIGFYMKISNGAPSLLMLNDGNLKISGDKVTIGGKATSVQLSQSKSEITESMGVQLTMDVKMDAGN